MTNPDPAVVLGRTFASRAEQLQDRIFSFYQEPAYFPELQTGTPCVLVGGRGTGKTTVLRGLSYQGQRALRGETPVADWPFFGAYLRVHTGKVAAFAGPELPDHQWQRVFGHYINLLLCDSVLTFIQWYCRETQTESLLQPDTVAAIAETLGIPDDALPSNEHGLLQAIGRLKRRFEVFVNTIADQPTIPLSVLGAPIDELVTSLMSHPALQGRLFFFLIDEYENLSSAQQRVVNTLIKHAGESYTFKIGVKELGWRVRTTVNEHEQLQAPADYAAININTRLGAPGVFESFATRICQERLEAVAREISSDVTPSVSDLLPRISDADEAELLGVRSQSKAVRAELERASDLDLEAFDALPPLYQYMIGFWARSHASNAAAEYADYLERPDHWDGRFTNYRHSLLFTLRAGLRGTRKYYAGFDTLIELAGDNIRFLVQLLEQSLRLHLESAGERWLHEPVGPEHQTRATHTVAQRTLVELEGLSLIGPRLTRLCVGLGRIFQVMAQRPGGHAPEVTQFTVDDLRGDLFADGEPPEAPSRPLEEYDDAARRLLAEAITHLALVQLPSTKMAGPEIREYDYMLHPIFSALFSYSYRRKRKMVLSSDDVLKIVSEPHQAIKEILERNNREDPASDEPLPEQMILFDRYLRDRAQS